MNQQRRKSIGGINKEPLRAIRETIPPDIFTIQRDSFTVITEMVLIRVEMAFFAAV